MARRWVLVVDDDVRLRELWTEVLVNAGYAAVAAEDGMTALELIRDLFPDLILLDLRMPRLSGPGFLKAVAGHKRWQTIPILIVSGFLEDEQDPEAASGLRVVGRMQKPVRPSELVERVRAAIGPSGDGVHPGRSS